MGSQAGGYLGHLMGSQAGGYLGHTLWGAKLIGN